MSRNGQIDYKYSLTTHSTKSQSLKKYHNNQDVSSSKYSTGGIRHHLKGTIHWRVSNKIVRWGNNHRLNITIC